MWLKRLNLSLYIGQTGDSLRARVRVHRQQIRDANYRTLDVSNHIFGCTQDLEVYFHVMPILKLPPNSTRLYREEKEKLCIRIINPTLNRDIWHYLSAVTSLFISLLIILCVYLSYIILMYLKDIWNLCQYIILCFWEAYYLSLWQRQWRFHWRSLFLRRKDW